MDNEEPSQKKKSRFSIMLNNISYRLSYTPALSFVAIMSIVCFLGFLFFLNERKLFADRLEVSNSCLVLMIFFAIFMGMFLILTITSIVLNIIRRKKGHR